MPSPTDLRRLLPSVDEVLQRPEVRALEARHGRGLVVREVRGLVEEARAQAAAGDREAVEAVRDALPTRLAARLERAQAPSLVSLINATGVVVHTNLGRSPLPASAAAQVARVATSLGKGMSGKGVDVRLSWKKRDAHPGAGSCLGLTEGRSRRLSRAAGCVRS